MASPHREDWEIIAYLAGDAAAVDVVEAGRHLADCTPCCRRAAAIKALRHRLEDDSPPAGGHGIRGLLEALISFRSAHEKTSADRNTQHLLGRPMQEWVGALSSGTSGEAVVDRLLEEARESLERDPQRALEILDGAASLVNEFQDVFKLSSRRAALAKERANALRILGRHPEALEELGWAERFLSHLPDREQELARVDWTRAAILLHLGKYEAALAAARRAMSLFEHLGEGMALEKVRMIEAGIRYEQGDLAGALDTYAQISRFFEAAGDRLTLARIDANLAECDMAAGDWNSMEQHAASALAAYASLGNETEQIRVRWTLAHALLRQQRFDDALEPLRAVHRSFEDYGMGGEAAGVLLDLVEVQVSRREWKAAEELAARAASKFTEMNAPLHVARACAHLREAVAGRNATERLVRYVRSYTTLPETAFDPPL